VTTRPGLARLYRRGSRQSDIGEKKIGSGRFVRSLFSAGSESRENRVLPEIAAVCDLPNRGGASRKTPNFPDTVATAPKDVKSLSATAVNMFRACSRVNFERRIRQQLLRASGKQARHGPCSYPKRGNGFAPAVGCSCFSRTSDILGARYWDFYDHITPLTHLSLREGLVKNGFDVESFDPEVPSLRFKSRFPTAGWIGASLSSDATRAMAFGETDVRRCAAGRRLIRPLLTISTKQGGLRMRFDLCVIGGCGHVGLPLSIAFGWRGKRDSGFRIDRDARQQSEPRRCRSSRMEEEARSSSGARHGLLEVGSKPE